MMNHTRVVKKTDFILKVMKK